MLSLFFGFNPILSLFNFIISQKYSITQYGVTTFERGCARNVTDMCGDEGRCMHYNSGTQKITVIAIIVDVDVNQDVYIYVQSSAKQCPQLI